MTDSPYLSIESLNKDLGGRPVLQDLFIRAEKGERLALTGENGAGKTTLIRILAGALKADSGNLRLGEARDPLSAAWRQQIAWAPQDIALDMEMNVRDQLRFWTRLSYRGREEQKNVLDRLYADPLVSDFLGRKTRQLSGGMLRRLNLMISLIRPAGLLLLDEPFVGADDSSAALMEERLLEDSRQQRLIIFCSHEKERVSRLATRILYLKGGSFEIGE